MPIDPSDRSNGTFERFFLDYYRSLVRLAAGIVGDYSTAEDVTQDAFVYLETRWSRVVEHPNPVVLARRAVANRAVNELRRRRRSDYARTRAVATIKTDGSATSDPALRNALGQLSPRQRAVVTLRYLTNLTTSETAETLGCTEATVRVHLHRGLAKLERTLDDN